LAVDAVSKEPACQIRQTYREDLCSFGVTIGLIGTVRVFDSLEAKFKVPNNAVKSQREDASPLLRVAQSAGAPVSLVA
jgi:hypothetical protein